MERRWSKAAVGDHSRCTSSATWPAPRCLRSCSPQCPPSLPFRRSELHFCNGLAFTFVRKMGAGISFEAGHGFVIRKIYTGGWAVWLASWGGPEGDT